MNKKVVALVLACVLIFSTIVAGTLAYLVSKTDTITNTFTFGQVAITLTETGATGEGSNKTQTFAALPGQKYQKDPVVTVSANSEDSYVFVKVTENIKTGLNFADYIVYSVNEGQDKTWTKLDGVDDVYYLQYTKNAQEQKYYVLTGEGDANLKNGVVTCPEGLTNDTISALQGENAALTFEAYAIQDEGFANASAAWTALQTAINA